MSQPEIPIVSAPVRKRATRGEARLDEVVSVAERVFLKRGFAAATMQEIAEEAGASKETLYRHYGNKEGLFAAIVRHRAALMSAELLNTDTEGEPREILTQAGLTYFRVLNTPRHLEMTRVIIAAVPRFPELGRILYDQGIQATMHTLSDYLRRETGRGRLHCAEPDHAARIFIAAAHASQHLIHLFNSEAPVWDDDRLQRHIDEVVAMFLARYGIPAGTVTS